MSQVSCCNARKRKCTVMMLVAAFCLFYCVAAPRPLKVHAESGFPSGDPTPTPTPTPKVGPPINITFDPSEPAVAPGNKVKITATVRDKDGRKVDDGACIIDWRIASPELDDFLTIKKEKDVLTAVGLFGNTLSSNGAKFIPSMVPIIVTCKKDKDKDDPLTRVINIRLLNTGVPPGPVPPGINPQVDIMWTVLPQNVVHDNFGGKIRKQYYCIEVVIGNDSGYDLQVASMGFEIPKDQGEEGGGKAFESPAGTNYRVPTTGYRMVRGSLERRQELSKRNIGLNIIRVFGPLLTGFTPYFFNINHRDRFTQAINIISNPIEQGYSLAFPDTTINQLHRLEDQTFRDDINTRTIVQNNTQVRTVVFFPKDFLRMTAKEGRDEPEKVMQRLGRLVMIGDVVEHMNRVRVVSNPLPGNELSISGLVTDRCGNGIEGVTVSLSGGPFFKGATSTTDSNGKYTFTNVPAGLNVTVTASKENAAFIFEAPVSQNFILNDNRTSIDFTVTLQKMNISGKVSDINGNVLGGVKVTADDGAGNKKDATTTADGSYKISDLPVTGNYTLKAELNGWEVTQNPTLDQRNCHKTNSNFVMQRKQTGPTASPSPSPTPAAQ